MSLTTPDISPAPAAAASHPKAPAKPYFENLDTLRAFSALFVFFYHAGLMTWAQQQTSARWLLLPVQLLSSGGWGVSFFFVLSGFLITWLLLEERRSVGRIDIKAFYLRRVFRIWPLYYAVLLAGAVLLPLLYKLMHQPLHFDYKMGLYAFFLSNFGSLSLDPAFNLVRSFPLVMNISWSVSIEEQYYLIWPLFFGLLPARALKWVAPLCILFSIVMAFFLRHNDKALYLNTGVRLGELAIGGTFAVALFAKARFFRLLERLPLVVIAGIYVLCVTGILYEMNTAHQPLVKYALRMGVCVLFALIIVEQNFARNSFFKFGRLKTFDRIGKISYGLYMLHPIALFFTTVLMQRLHQEAAGPLYILVALVLTLAAARLSYRYFETPFLRIKKRFEKMRS